jgi:hypothetical protein
VEVITVEAVVELVDTVRLLLVNFQVAALRQNQFSL